MADEGEGEAYTAKLPGPSVATSISASPYPWRLFCGEMLMLVFSLPSTLASCLLTIHSNSKKLTLVSTYSFFFSLFSGGVIKGASL